MKKKILVILAAIMLLTGFASCGGVKKEDIIGNWVWTYTEDKDGTRRNPTEKDLELSKYLRITEDTFEVSVGDEYDPCNWELSGSDIKTYSLSGIEYDTYVYKNGELIVELSNGIKRIYVKQ